MFWDGTTNQTDKITDFSSWTGHLGTLVARGSIVRVLFDDLNIFLNFVLLKLELTFNINNAENIPRSANVDIH